MKLAAVLEVLALLGAGLLALSKVKFVETLLDEELKRWLASRPRRQLSRRVSDEELKRILTSEREELETLCLLLQREYQADRVTVMEYHCPKAPLRPTATCTVEVRAPRISSVRAQFQKTPLSPELWSQVEQVHATGCRCLYVPDARLLDSAETRRTLVASGVRSAYYQSLPTLPGTCGGMLSISWAEPGAQLSEEDLAALHFSARTLAAVLRSIWAWQADES